ncbi:MAG: hypothetical protein PHP74_04235 [Candidatus Gracilibacteria bacterium]|nr:hypothetical protein [Candidatus Gracilibacteria bacterium]
MAGETPAPRVNDTVLCFKVKAHPRDARGRLTEELVDAHAGDPIVAYITKALRDQVQVNMQPVISSFTPTEVFVGNEDLRYEATDPDGRRRWSTEGPYRHPRFENMLGSETKGVFTDSQGRGYDVEVHGFDAETSTLDLTIDGVRHQTVFFVHNAEINPAYLTNSQGGGFSHIEHPVRDDLERGSSSVIRTILAKALSPYGIKVSMDS